MREEVLASLSVISIMSAGTALAQTCTTAPSCDTLGFTDKAADCAGGRMLKCPFDQSKVFCAGSSGENGDAGDTGVDPKDATPGMIYYSDGTISADVIDGKTPVGVVAYNSANRIDRKKPGGAAYNEETHRFVVALEETNKQWGGFGRYLSCTGGLSDIDDARTDMNGKENTQCLPDNEKLYPAITYCNSFKAVASGTGSSGWYLPAAGELYVMKFGYDAINSGLQKLSKKIIRAEGYWSSTEREEYETWITQPSNGFIGNHNKTGSFFVRCVLAF